MADKNAPLAIKMLHYYGFTTRTDVTSEFAGISGSDIGRADVVCGRMGKAVHVEIKRGIDTFNLEDWRINQRQWGAWTIAPPFCVPYYVFLTLGKHPATYNARSYMPKRSWLVPLHAMLEIAAKVQPVQKSLVYKVKPRMKKAIQEGHLDAVTLLADYELVWQSNSDLVKPAWMSDPGSQYGGFWIVPETHEFWKMFIDPDADGKLFLPTQEMFDKVKALVPAYVSPREQKAKIDYIVDKASQVMTQSKRIAKKQPTAVQIGRRRLNTRKKR